MTRRAAATRRCVFLGVLGVAPLLRPLLDQQTLLAQRTLLAVGAHAGDMELTCGAFLARQKQRGDRVVLLHLTLGEGGHPGVAPERYAAQKRREAIEAAQVLGAEVRFAPFLDGQLPDDDEARRYVADVIRELKPTHVITHWKRSLHKDHAVASRVVADAVLLASLDGVRTAHPAYRGVRSVWYAENWEDADDFQPYVLVEVGATMSVWRQAVTKYEFVRGGISSFRYLEYYDALSVVRGAVARLTRAEAFDVDPSAKRRVVDSLP